VAVFKSEIRYLAPVTGDFYVLVPVPAEEITQAFGLELQERSRAKLALTAAIYQDGEEKVRYRGRYAVWMRQA
jgi:thioesterase domain-containing protein